MKTRKTATYENGDGASQTLEAKAATARHLADMAKKHFKMLKSEYKQARKAYKQARKAAKRARKEAKAALKLLKSKPEPARRTTARKAKRPQTHRRAHPATSSPIPLPTSATANVSAASA